MKRTFLVPVSLLFVCSLLFAQPWFYVAGHTWSDDQYQAGGGRMIDHDPDGWVHVVWDNGLSQYFSDHHVNYNLWDPDTETFLYSDGGNQIDAGQQAGYPTLAVNYDGRCYPVFHQTTTTTTYHTAASIDFLPRSGAFITSENDYISELDMLWPRIAIDSAQQVLHVIAAELIDYGHYVLYYTRGVPIYDIFGFGEGIDYLQDWQFIDSLAMPAYDITVSQNPNISHVAITWTKSRNELADRWNNDLVYIESTDGGANFSDEINITRFEEPDWECLSGDTAVCNRDTFRVHAGITSLYDNYDNLNIVFQTSVYYAMQAHIVPYAGQLWHWSQSNGAFTPIRAVASDYAPEQWFDLHGRDELAVQHPSLTLDRATGELFCTYAFSDSTQWNRDGFPLADVWVSRSTDLGLSWSDGLNVTNSNGGQGTCTDACPDESFPSASRFVQEYDAEVFLDVFFMRDLNGGPDSETDRTFNPVYYGRIEASRIPAEPVRDSSWPRLHVDTTETISAQRESIISLYTLHQNYPNPFNSTTTIRYDLPQTATVSLIIFNLIGQKIAQPLLNRHESAGTHSVAFDASSLSSGIYFYRLETDNHSFTRKMMLLK